MRLLCFCGIFAGCCRYFDDGMTRAIAPAMLEMGMVWSQTLPGPVSSVLNRPSPPSSLFFMPGTC